ncbi:MAG TPA: mannose-6-phosphate isomerase, class I [Microbacterium sp.]|uniref:mannose-6-phosphate isomerase, class I n=1 Tax=Microbacterium sp. TaxID=51671 RepID=UPI002BF241FA|nr:mannose-6-phosphate isomerase, class I [Microbacterium sp.]HWI30323.1 mannose-6-phosphate isomerase, class I [Microbacterium sp.]
MMLPLTNPPKDYAWGSRTLIAALEGRPPSDAPEAEVWFGDHPGGPALVGDGSGRTLDTVLAAGVEGAPERLPYLLKLLAAASPLSIQVHPSKAQAIEGFARETGLPADAPNRNYRDDNHKPELIVALSDTFEALCGLRPLAATRRLVGALGQGLGPAALRARLERPSGDAAIGGAEGEDADILRDVIGWLLGGSADVEVASLIDAIGSAESVEFAAELATTRRIASVYPGDPGVVVALLMNHVVLRRGEAVFLRAGLLHAYISGLGVELMAASDNVLRGGLTPKHVDVAELLSVLDARPAVVPVVLPTSAEGASRGVEAFATDAPDFELLRARVNPDSPATVTLRGAAIALVTAGTITVVGGHGDRTLRPGQAVFVTRDESPVRLAGDGEVFIAQPGSPG